MPHDLVVLVSLSGKQYYITAACVVNSGLNRLGPVTDAKDRRMLVLQPGHDFVDDALRLLRAGIIAGHDDEIGIVCRDSAHDGPLESIPVAAAAKEDDQPASGDVPQRF